MVRANIGLEFKENGIADILLRYSMTVPLNQRSYRWEESHVETLMQDLTRAFKDRVPIYFLGTIVLTRGKSQYEIADGQQRLATTSIIIAAVRDYLLELGDEQGANNYQSKYLLEYEPRSKKYQPKVTLNYEDRDFFLKTILQPPNQREEYQGTSFSSHSRLSAAKSVVDRFIRNLTASYLSVEDKANRLHDWMEFLNNSALVIVIEVPDEVGDVFKMFETLNARGLRASQLDILKNYFYDIGDDYRADLHPSWLAMISTIESIGDDDLLIDYIRHYWIAHHGPTTERELGEEIQKTVKSDRHALDTVKALESFALDYVALFTPREHPQLNEFSRASRNCLYTITKEVRVKQMLPLLLAIIRYFPVREAEKALSLCLSWSVRFLVSGGAGGGVLERNYGLRAKEISQSDIKSTEELAYRMISVVPNDQVFKSSFEVISVRLTHFARYYLRAIDLYEKSDPFPQFVPNEDVSSVNIEHVLPVNPGEEWNISRDKAENYYKRLGNLTLFSTPVNVKIGNKAFNEKKAEFAKSPFLMTSMIATYPEWGPDEINDRQKKLAELAPKVWPL